MAALDSSASAGEPTETTATAAPSSNPRVSYTSLSSMFSISSRENSNSNSNNNNNNNSDTNINEDTEDEEQRPFLWSPPQQQYRRWKSLARTAPCFLSLLIFLAIAVTHVLFYYGQTAPMWRLVVHQEYDIWINATSKQAQWTFDTLGLHPHQQHLEQLPTEHTVRQFTYGYALQELWQAKDMPGKFLPRLTAVLLVFCSGIWPHLKLFLLNITFFVPMRSLKRRKRFLHWLSTLGKWSLADVLTVCVMVAVLRLEWDMQPDEIQQGIITHLPTLIPMVHDLYTANDVCSKLLKYDCSHPKVPKHMAKCRGCKSLVAEAYTHPSWAQTTGKSILKGVHSSGGGTARLSVVGMHGIYLFCVAVIASIGLSLVVDALDLRDRKQQQQRTRQQQQQLVVDPETNDTSEQDEDIIEGTLTEPLLVQQPSSSSSSPPPVPIVYPQPSAKVTWTKRILSGATSIIVLLAAFSPTMCRQATGAIPSVLHDILGITWEKPYSFQTLMQTTGLAGGWDWLLMATFSLFIVAGPIVRALLCFLQSFTRRPRPGLAASIDFIGAFCAWEVLGIAVVMVDMLMPTITNTIIHKPDLCSVVSPDGSCLQVDFDVLKSQFAYVVVGGVLLVGVSAWAVVSGRGHTLEDFDYRIVQEEQENTTADWRRSTTTNTTTTATTTEAAVVDEEEGGDYEPLGQNSADNAGGV